MSNFHGAAAFNVHAIGDEAAGFEVDNVDPWPTAPLTYASLGDSYSSGVGGGAYFPSGGCNVSPGSWTYLLATKNPGAFTNLGNYACDGATSDDVLDTGLPQLESQAFSFEAPDVVTLTMGGDDDSIFHDTLETCYSDILPGKSCAQDGTIANATTEIENEASYLPGDYEQIVEGLPAGTRLLVVGYPDIIPSTKPYKCGWLSSDDQTGLRQLATTFDSVLSTAAAEASVQYVSSLSSFAGHELCTRKSWVNAISIANGVVGDAGHPTSAGQDALEGVVAKALGT